MMMMLIPLQPYVLLTEIFSLFFDYRNVIFIIISNDTAGQL